MGAFRKSIFIGGAIASLFIAAASPQAAETATTRLVPAGRSRSHGSWGESGGRRGMHPWALDVRREANDRISGRVDLGDSPLAAAGNVDGRIDGKLVSGRITDDVGQLIARFEGSITATGMEGVYRDRSGEAGRWSWEGVLR